MTQLTETRAGTDPSPRRARRNAGPAATSTGRILGATHVPHKPDLDAPEERVRIGASFDDRMTMLGATGAGIGAGIVLAGVLGVIGWGWMPIVSYFWFVGFYTVLTFINSPGPVVRDRFWGVILRSAGVVVIASLGLVVVFTIVEGREVFFDLFSLKNPNPLHFFTDDMSGVGPLDGVDVGGVVYALVGTLEQIGIALAITVPLGLTAAVFLGEIGGPYARVVRTIVEAMTALPSVVAGLFIYAFIIITFTHESSGFAASLAITVLMLPIMIRSADVVLRLVPGNLREAGLALGASKWATVWRVVLPTVRGGLTTAVILATAHGIGETAPVLLTSGVTSVTNFDPFHNNQTSLPLAALEFIEAGRQSLKVRGYATAALLLLLVLVLFVLARVVGGNDGSRMGAPSGRARRRSAAILSRITRVTAAAMPARTWIDAPPPDTPALASTRSDPDPAADPAASVPLAGGQS